MDIEKMRYKLTTLNIAKQHLKKELTKAEKEVVKHSNKLGSVNMQETTLKGRAKLRMNLDIACESRDIVQRHLDFTERWMQEVRDEYK